MKHSFKRTLSLVLALVMALSCMSLSVWAEPVANEAAIGDTGYATLTDAIAAANNDTNATAENPVVVELLKDISVSAVIMISNHVTLDGNDHTVTTTANRGIRIDKGEVTVTVKDLTITGTSMERAIQVDTYKDNVNLTIDHVTATATYYTVNICNYVDNLVLTVKDSTLTGWGVINLWGNNGTVDISGSTLTGINDKSYDANGWNNFGVVVMEGDTTGQTDEHSSAYTVNISNTTIEARSTTGNMQSVLLHNNPSAENDLALDQCTIKMGENCRFFLDQAMNSTTKIRDTYMEGTTDRPTLPSSYIYLDIEDNYKLITKTVAKIKDGDSFPSLAAAVAAVQDGQTIILLSNVTLTETAGTIEETGVTLDMNGKTITYAPSYAAKADYENLLYVTGDLTITGEGTIAGPTDEDAAKYDGCVMISVGGNTGKLTYLNGTLTVGGSGSDGMYGVYMLNGGTAIFGSEEYGTGPSISAHFAAIGENHMTAPANVTVYGGTYTAAAAPTNNEWWSYFCAPVYAAASGSIVIEGGTFNGYYAISDRYADVEQTLSIKGGTFNGSSEALFVDSVNGSNSAADRSIVIEGGKFTTDPRMTGVSISDGSTITGPTGGYYTVAPAVAQIGDVKYTSLRDALDSIPANNESDVTIKLLADIQLPWSNGKFALDVNKDHVIIDGQNFTISPDGSDSWDQYKVGGAKQTYGNYNLIQVSGKNVTVQNVTVNGGSEYRGVSCMTTVGGENVTYKNVTYTGRGSGHYYGTAKGTLTFDGCTINTKGYAIHCSGGGTAYDLVIKDCSLYGWNSCGSASSLTISDTKFYGANDEGKNGLLAMLRPYCPTTITNCEFSTDYTNNESPYTGLTTGAAVTVTLNDCTMSDGSDVTAIVDYDAFEGAAAANGSVFAFDATKDGSDKYTGGTFVTKSTVTPIAEDYQAYPVAENVYKVLPVVSADENTPSNGDNGIATEGNTTATATEVVTGTGANEELLSYKVEVTKGAAAPETVYVAPPAVDVNEELDTEPTKVITDANIAELVASVAAKAVNESNATTNAEKAAVAQAAVNSIEGYEYASLPKYTTPTATGGKIYDVVPTVTATKTVGEETVVLGTAEITNSQVPADANIPVELTGIDFITGNYAKVTHYIGSDDNTTSEQLANWGSGNTETFTVAVTGGKANFTVNSFSKFEIATSTLIPVAKIEATGFYYDNYAEAFTDAANGNNTVALLAQDTSFTTYTLADGETLSIQYATTDFERQPNTITVYAATPANYSIQTALDTTTDENDTIVFTSVEVGTHTFKADAEVTKTLKEGTDEVTFIKSYSDDASYSNNQYVEIPITLTSDKADEAYKGVTLYLSGVNKVTIVDFTPAAGVTATYTAINNGKVALVPTTDDEFAYGTLLGTLKLKVNDNAEFTAATDTVTLSADIARDRNLEDTLQTITGTYTYDVGYLVTLESKMDDTLVTAEQYVATMSLGGADATLATTAPFGASVSKYFKAGTTGIIVAGTPVDSGYQLQDEAGKLLTNAAGTTNRDTDDTAGIAFTAPTAGNETLNLHFEAKTFVFTFNTNKPDNSVNGYPFTSGNTVNTTPDPVQEQSVKYNVETTLNGTTGAPLNTFTLTGWDFDGWTTTANNYSATDELATGAAVTPGIGNVTYYAKWTPKAYQVEAKYAEDWAGTFAPTTVPYGDTYTGTTVIAGYDANKYSYVATVKNTDGDKEFNATIDGGTISFSATTAATQGIEPGSTLQVYVTRALANVTVEAYPLSNNVVLVRAYSPSNELLKYYGEEMVYDQRWADATVGTVGELKSCVMLIDATMDENTTSTAMTDIADTIRLSDNFSANAFAENYVAIASAKSFNDATKKIVKNNFNVNIDAENKVDIVDVTLVYNAYKGSYSYSVMANKGGMLDVHAMQYYLSDVTFSNGIAVPTSGLAGSAATNLWSNSDGASQLVNMTDVQTIYEQAYGTTAP